MEEKLYHASVEGDVNTLQALMAEDKLTLARLSISSCFNQTPLHLASMLGHFEFTKSLLSYQPDFASRLDSQGRSPLHLASANGYAKIVKLLVDQDSSMCRVCDEDGRTPLMLAVMNGQHESVKELINVCGLGDEEDEKILQLCVSYNQLNVLILIVEAIGQDLSHIKDEKGNNVLHSATSLKRMQIIKYLVSRSKVAVNEVNGNGLTALDIIEQIPIDVKTIEIKQLLISAGAQGSKQINAATTNYIGISKVADNTPSISEFKRLTFRNIESTTEADESAAETDSNSKLKMWKKVKNFTIFKEKQEKRDKTLLVAASVIAAMAYQAAISPPGGVAGLDATVADVDKSYNLQPAGSLLSYFYPRLNTWFWISNTISFMAALSVIFLFVSGASLRRRIFIWLLRAAMWVTLSSMTIAYLCAVTTTTLDTDDFYNGKYPISSSALYTWVGLVSISFLVLTYRSLSYIAMAIVKKMGTKKKKNRTEDATTFIITDTDAV